MGGTLTCWLAAALLALTSVEADPASMPDASLGLDAPTHRVAVTSRGGGGGGGKGNVTSRGGGGGGGKGNNIA